MEMIKNDSFSDCYFRPVLWHGNHHVSAEPVFVMEIINLIAEIMPVIILGLVIFWVGKNNPDTDCSGLPILPPEDWDCDWYEIWEEEEKKGDDDRDHPR